MLHREKWNSEGKCLTEKALADFHLQKYQIKTNLIYHLTYIIYNFGFDCISILTVMKITFNMIFFKYMSVKNGPQTISVLIKTGQLETKKSLKMS